MPCSDFLHFFIVTNIGLSTLNLTITTMITIMILIITSLTLMITLVMTIRILMMTTDQLNPHGRYQAPTMC